MIRFLALLTFLSLSATHAEPIDFSKLGYARVRAAAPPVSVARPRMNAAHVMEEMTLANHDSVSVLAFPELYLTGYTAEDYLFRENVIGQVQQGLKDIKRHSQDFPDLVTVIGAPIATPDGRFYNAAYVIHKGEILGVVPKVFLPNYGEFYERRWFDSGADVELNYKDPVLGPIHLSKNQIFVVGSMRFAIEVCEDGWAVIPPSSEHVLNGANVIFNLSASNELAGKSDFRRQLVQGLSSQQIGAYVYVSAGPTESSRDLVFGGHNLIAENGEVLAESERFQFQGSQATADIDLGKLLNDRRRNKTFGSQRAREKDSAVEVMSYLRGLTALQRHYARNPFLDFPVEQAAARAAEITEIQTTGLMRRLSSARSKKILIGVSGGLDSTLALLVAWRALRRMGRPSSDIVAVTMPGFGTTGRTKSQAFRLMEALNVAIREIPIGAAVNQHFADIGHDPNLHDITYENSQARERTQILFDLANQEQGLVLGTGDLSELCVGYCTYNGDHMSSYNVNASVPKTMSSFLIREFAEAHTHDDLKQVLLDIVATEYSPELLPPDAEGKIQQKSESTVGPYELIDFFIYHSLRNNFSDEKIKAIAQLAFGADYTAEKIAYHWATFKRLFEISRFKSTALPPV